MQIFFYHISEDARTPPSEKRLTWPRGARFGSLALLTLLWAPLAFSAEPDSQGTGASSQTTSPTDGPKRSSGYRLAPIATAFGGDIGYDIQQRNSNKTSPLVRQRLVLNLKGRARTYIVKPWIATVSGYVNLTSSKSKTGDSTNASNGVTGSTSLYVVPYSTYPFDASYSKSNSYSGAGFGSLGSTTTRFEMNQRITPRKSFERYQLGYYQSTTETSGPALYRQNGLTLNFLTSRYSNQVMTVGASRTRNHAVNNGTRGQLDFVNFSHRYQPSSEFSISDEASYNGAYYEVPGESIGYRNREANSTASYQPNDKPYSLIGAARTNFSDNSNTGSSSRSKSANANLSGNYRLSTYVRLSASGNVNVSERDSVRTQSITTTQSASLNYPLATFDVDKYHYSSQISASVYNRTSSTERAGYAGSRSSGSTQSASISPSHSLSHSSRLGAGTLSVGLNQSLSASESTTSQARASLNHSATASWNKNQSGTHSSARISGSDRRSLNNTQDSFQFFSVSASVSEEINRNSSLSADISAQASRQLSSGTSSTTADPNTSSTYNNSSASIHYTHARAFNLRNMKFDSNFRANSRSALPVFSGTETEQGPITWDNTLSYSVGRLISEFSVSLSKEGDGTSQSLIWFSLKRYF